MLIEIFKTGTHTDSAGKTRTWTEEDLDKIAQKYNPAEHEAPVVIGHPKDNAPAYGWVERLVRKGDILYAKLKDLVPEFVEAVKKGLYKKRSISLYPDMTLRHVGFLGAMPPAVKGLADVQFSETEAVTMEFAETKEPEAEASAFNEGGLDMDKVHELETKLKEKESALSEFAEREKVKEEEIARLKKELEAERARQTKAEFNSFCDSLIGEGRLTPAMKPLVMDFMEILHGVGEYEFSEGDGRSKAKPVEKFKAFLSGLSKQVEFAELATKDKAEEGKPKPKDFKEMTGWELIDLYRTDAQEFRRIVEAL